MEGIVENSNNNVTKINTNILNVKSNHDNTTPPMNNATELQQHPMIPVPTAIREVLRCTAELQMQLQLHLQLQRKKQDQNDNNNDHNHNKNNCKEVESLSIFDENLINRISSSEIRMPSPGYPPYVASIVDGYAIHVEDSLSESLSSTSLNENENQVMVVLDVIDRIYAGDDTDADAGCDNIKDDDNNPKVYRRPTSSYVTTGAPIPSHYDAVLPIEDVSVAITTTSSTTKSIISIPRQKIVKLCKGNNGNRWIRPVGCDIPTGAVVLGRGEQIRSHHLGLLVQAGWGDNNDDDDGGNGIDDNRGEKIEVRRLPKVGILSTGNELYDSLAPSSCHRSNRRRRPGLIPDANRPMLLSLLRSHQNCSLIDLGIVSDDDRIKLKRKLNDALDDCDVLITTGGISVGEKDVVEKVLTTELDCCIQFGRLHMKPGKPTTFLTRGEGDSDGGDYGVDLKKKQCLVFALPGNPVSARVCTELLVVPCLNMLFLGDADTTTPPGEKMGMMEMVEENTADIICRMVDNAYVHPEIRARLVSPSRIKLDTGRPEYHRVILDARCADSDKENGVHNYHYEATSTGVQRSSRLLSMSNADGMMLLPQGSAEGKQYAVSGEVYPVLLSPYYSSYSNNGKGVRVKDSFHLRKSNDTMTEPIISTHISIGDKKERVSSNKLNIGLLNIVGNDIEKVSSSYPSGSSKYTDDGKTKEMQNTGRPKRKLLISEPPFANKNNDLITLKQRILKVLKLCLHQDNHGVDNGDNIGEVKVVKSSSVTLLNEDTLNTSSSSYTPSSIIPQMVLELFSPSPVLNSNSNSSSIQYNENKDHSSNAIDENGVVDIVIVVCTNTDLRTSLDVSSVLRSILTATVPGKAMELESRRGAASIRPLSVLFDPVVGYVDPSNHHNCCNSKYDGRSMTFAIMVIPDGGMEGALRRVVGPLLGRGLNVARGL